MKKTDVNSQKLNHTVLKNIWQCLQAAQLLSEFTNHFILFTYDISWTWNGPMKYQWYQPKLCKCLHSVVHFSGSSIRCCLVCSSSFFSQSYLARTSEILCCRYSKIFSLALKYTTSWEHNNNKWEHGQEKCSKNTLLLTLTLLPTVRLLCRRSTSSIS